MDEWLHNLPVWWMALVVFAITYLATGGIFATIMALAKGERVRAFKALSPALLSPMGTIFGLLVVFSVVQVWSDMDRANVAVNREASAIRMVALLAPSFPGEPETQILDLLRHHIDEAVFAEWATMAKQSASLRVAPPALAEALRLAVSLAPNGERQIAAQREIVTELRKCNGRAPSAHYPQPVKRELGQVDLPVRAGRLYADRDRHCSQRQSRRCRDRDGDLCNRGGRIRAADRQPRPAVQRRDLRQTRCASASQAGVIIQSALEVNPFLTISALAERIVENNVTLLTP